MLCQVEKHLVGAFRGTARLDRPPAEIKIVKIKDISVTGATQNNVTGDKNWATVKGSGDVIIEVELEPALSDSEAIGIVTWTGATAVPNKPLQRKVSKGSSAKTTVKATCGTSEKEVDIWVIWAIVTIQVSGYKMAPKFPIPKWIALSLWQFDITP